MTIGEILFLLAFGIVWIAVMVFIFKRMEWIHKVGKQLSKSTENIISRSDNLMMNSPNALKGNALENIETLEFSQMVNCKRVLTRFSGNGIVGYYLKEKLAALASINFTYTFLDNSGSSLNGHFSLYDGAGNNIKVEITNGIATLSNEKTSAKLDFPNRKIIDSIGDIIGTTDGSLLGGGKWTIRDVNNNEICKLSAARIDWANSINGINLATFDKLNSDQSQEGLIEFFESLTKEKNVRWPVFPQQYDFSKISEEMKMSLIFLGTLLYVLYFGAYRQ